MERREVQDLMTYCVVCGSAIYWDGGVRPAFVRPGNDRILGCLQTGCALVAVNGRNATNFELFRMNLLDAGVPEGVATEIAAIVSTRFVQAAA